MNGEWIERKNYRKKILFTEEDLESKGVRIQLVEVDANNTVKPHYHESQTEVYNVQRGRAILRIGENNHKVSKGDTLICKPGTVHGVKNRSDEVFRLLVIKTNYEENDSYWL